MVITDGQCRNLARELLREEDWFHKQPGADKQRFIDSLAEEIANAARDQIEHFRESRGFTGEDSQ